MEKTMGDPVRVLHVDDDPESGALTAEFLERESDRFDVVTETNVEAGLARLTRDDRIDCIVSDYDMPGSDGLAFLDAVREIDADLPFIMFTEKGSEGIASRAISAGVTDYLQKGSETDQYAILANRIRNAVEGYRARQEVVASERRLRRIHERITDGFVAIDADWRYTHVNSVAEELLDRSAEALRGETVWESFPELVDSPFEDALRTAMESQETTSVTEYYLPLDAWFEVRAYPSEEGLSIYFTDVTERAAYRRELERFRELVENVPIGIFRTEADEGGVFVEVNSALVSMFDGADRSDLLNVEVRDLYADETDRRRAIDVLEDQGKITTELEFRTLDGETFWGRVTSYFVETETGRYLDGAIEDITETVEKRDLLEEQNERLAVLNRVLRHDIANDMQVALGMSDRLRSHVDDGGREHLDRLAASVDHAVDVIDSVGSLTGAMLSEEGSEPVPTALGPVLESELHAIADAAESAVVEHDGACPRSASSPTRP